MRKKKNKKLNGFQKRQQKKQKLQTNHNLTLIDKLVMINRDVEKEFGFINRVQVNKEKVIRELEGTDLINSYAKLNLGIDTCYGQDALYLDLIWTNDNTAPRGYGKKIIQYLQRLCLKYNLHLKLIGNSIKYNKDFKKNMNQDIKDFENFKNNFNGRVKPKVLRGFKNFITHNNRYREWLCEEPNYTHKEGNAFIFDFYYNLGFNVYLQQIELDKPSWSIQDHINMVWLNPNLPETYKDVVYLSILGQHKVYSYQESIDFITRIYREQSFEQINKYDDLLKLKLTLKETIDVSKERKGIEEDVSNPLVVNSIIKRGFLGHLPDQEYFHDYLIPLSSSMEITKEVKEGGISKWNKFINDRGNVNATN